MCPQPSQVKHGDECTTVGTCAGHDGSVLDTQPSCECVDGRWQCRWAECPDVCMQYGPLCPGGALPSGCTCQMFPPPPMQNGGGCCCTQMP
jgi:hypothetical protein